MAESTFDAQLFERLRSERGLTLGVPLTAVAETSSTNNDAIAASRAGVPHGALFVADYQRHGRGRRGHGWTSPAHLNLMASLVLRPRVSADRASSLTLVAGLAVRAAAARHLSARVQLKWPNDVVVEDKKLAGILVESQLVGSTVEGIIVGIGMNVAMRELPEEIRAIATSLSLLGSDAGREQILADVLAELEPRLSGFEASGLGPFAHELAEHDALIDRRVRVDGVEGTGAGIDPGGALCVRRDDGDIASVTSGAVTLL